MFFWHVTTIIQTDNFFHVMTNFLCENLECGLASTKATRFHKKYHYLTGNTAQKSETTKNNVPWSELNNRVIFHYDTIRVWEDIADGVADEMAKLNRKNVFT